MAVRDDSTLKAIVQHYIDVYRESAASEIEFYEGQPSLEKAIELAGHAVDEHGKRHSHHRRRKQSELDLATDSLLANKWEIRRVQDFSDLHKLVGSVIGGIPGIGALFVYDTSLRLGAYLGKLPVRVYLHSGTWIGAVNMGFDRRRGVLEVAEFPDALRALSARELEDCLCLYKEDLGRWYDGERIATIRNNSNCRMNGGRSGSRC